MRCGDRAGCTSPIKKLRNLARLKERRREHDPFIGRQCLVVGCSGMETSIPPLTPNNKHILLQDYHLKG